MVISKQVVLTYVYLLVYILLSSGVILFNKWVLSPKYFNFPFPITLTMIHMGFSGLVAFFLVRVFKVRKLELLFPCTAITVMVAYMFIGIWIRTQT